MITKENRKNGLDDKSQFHNTMHIARYENTA